MHRKQKAELLLLDIELERTLRNLRKAKGAKEATMANRREKRQPIPEEAETERPRRQMTMEDFWRSMIQDEYSVVRKLTILI